MQLLEEQNKWDIVIKSKTRLFDLKLNEIYQYKNLIWIFVKRNYSTRYKQMILGPAWLIISPLFTILTYTIVFGGIAGLSTDGVPKPLFYLSGNIMWGFFANGVFSNSNTFTGNAGLFGKIYFPRMVVPISTMLTLLFDFLIQFSLMVLLMLFYIIRGVKFSYNWTIIYLPLYLLQLGLLAMGIGIIVSSLTTKYRDLGVLVNFGVQIWMYASPVIYSITLVPQKFQLLFMLNPVTPVLLAFKYSFFGIGEISYGFLGISWLMTLIIVIIGMIIFNQVEKNFMDTV